MLNAKNIMLAVFLVFFVANSYSGEVRALMWPVKFLVLGLFSFFIIYTGKHKKKYLGRTVPGYVYALLITFFVFGLISFNVYDGVFAQYINLGNPRGYLLLAGLLVVTLFSAQLTRFLSVAGNQEAFYFALKHGAAIITFSNLILFLLGINLGRGGGEVGGAGGVGRFSGWLDNPNTLGVILLGAYPVVLQESLQSSKKMFWISYERLILISMVLLLLLTGSRSALLGIAIMSAIILWTHSSKTRIFGILLTFLSAFLFLVESGLVEETMVLPQFQRQGEDTLSGRTEVWKLGLQLVRESPFFGYGMGVEADLINAVMPITAVHQGNNVHNSYLSLLISSGYIGAIPLLALFAIAVMKSIMLFLQSRKRSNNFTFLMSTLFIGFMFHGFFETWLFSPGSVYGFVFWTSCFWLLSKQRRPRRFSNNQII